MSHVQGSPDLITGRTEGSRPLKETIVLALATISGPALIYALIVISHRIAAPEDRDAATLLAYGLPMFAWVGVFLFYARRSGRELRERIARSLVVPGEVTAVEVSGVRGDSGYKEIPTLRFAAAKDNELREVVSAESREKLSVGEAVDVRYDPEDASWVIVDRRDPDHRMKIIATAGGMAIFGLVPTIWGVALILGS